MSFARSLATVSGLTILSRVAGFVRDTLTATYLGAGPIADAFFVAQRLPNLFRTLFAEGAFASAFVPLYTAEREKHGLEAAQRFAGQALVLLIGILLPFSALVMLLMPWAMHILAPGFEQDPVKYQFAVDFSTITFPYLALISITALQTGVLNAQGKFGPGAAAPIAFNIVLIAGLFLARAFHWHVGYTQSWAFAFSGVVQMVWLMISCHRAGVSIPLVRPVLGEAIRRLFRRIAPGAIGAGASQINLLISTILASLLPTGAVSHLFYADRLNQLPIGVVGVAVGTTLLPILTKHIEADRHDHAHHYMNRAIEFCLLLGLPATIGLAIAAQPIIGTLFEHGAFTHADTVATAGALTAYALGIPAFLLVKVFAAGFFARHDTKTPVKIAMMAMITNVLMSLLLLGLLQHIGIALANSLAVCVNALLLFICLRRKIGALGDAKLRQRGPKIIFCAVVMGLLTWGLVAGSRTWFIDHGFVTKALMLAVVIGSSSLVYGLLLQLTGAMRLGDLRATLKAKN